MSPISEFGAFLRMIVVLSSFFSFFLPLAAPLPPFLVGLAFVDLAGLTSLVAYF